MAALVVLGCLVVVVVVVALVLNRLLTGRGLSRLERVGLSAVGAVMVTGLAGKLVLPDGPRWTLPDGTVALAFAGPHGDHITGGQRLELSLTAGQVRAVQTKDSLSLTVGPAPGLHHVSVTFGWGVRGPRWGERYDVDGTSQPPSFSLVADHGTCSPQHGHFTVAELDTDAGGISRLVATFRTSCGDGPAVTGAVRWTRPREPATGSATSPSP